MRNKYTLSDARSFVKTFGRTNDLAKVLNNFDDLKQSLKIFANRKDKENFNLLTKKYLEMVNTDGPKNMKVDSYKLLELLCYDIDNRPKEKKGKAVKLFETYLKNIEIKYNTINYSLEEIYEKIDSLSDSLVSQYSRRISNTEKRWNGERDTMNFHFKLREYDISGNIKLGKNELIVNSEIPLEAKLHRKAIVRKIKERLEKALPKLSESK